MALTKAQKREIENHRKYWQDREDEALKHYIKDEQKFDKEIKRIYRQQLDSVQEQINSFYGRYADKEGITLAEAKKRVRKLDIEAYERKAKRYVKDRDFSKKANEEMRLYNLTMKVNRLEMLKANIGLELIAGHDELDKYMEEILQGRTMEELERQAGILGKSIQNNARLAETIPNASFHNATFSDRIWMHQDLLKADITKLLTTGMIQGKHPRVLAKELKKLFDVKTSDAERLMQTELARVQTEAQRQSFERNEYEMYMFLPHGDCCYICEELKNEDIGYGKGVFFVKDMQPGVNAPPLHPRCRCSIAAVSQRQIDQALAEREDKGGSTDTTGIENAQTVEDVENLLKAHKDWFYSTTIDGKKYNSGEYIMLKGADLQSAKEVLNATEMLYNKYPQLKGKLNAMNVASLPAETYGKTLWGLGHGGIALNSRYYGDNKRFIASFNNDISHGYHPPTNANPAANIFMHEMGHAIDDYLTNTLKLAGTTPKGKQKAVSATLRPQVMKASGFKVSYEDISREVSGYATKDNLEWFAECFTEYMLSDNPRPVAAEFGKQLDKIITEEVK